MAPRGRTLGGRLGRVESAIRGDEAEDQPGRIEGAAEIRLARNAVVDVAPLDIGPLRRIVRLYVEGRNACRVLECPSGHEGLRRLAEPDEGDSGRQIGNVLHCTLLAARGGAILSASPLSTTSDGQGYRTCRIDLLGDRQAADRPSPQTASLRPAPPFPLGEKRANIRLSGPTCVEWFTVRLSTSTEGRHRRNGHGFGIRKRARPLQSATSFPVDGHDRAFPEA